MRKHLSITLIVASLGMLSLWIIFDKRDEPSLAHPVAKKLALSPSPRMGHSTPPSAISRAGALPEQASEPIAAFAGWLQRYRVAPANLRTSLIGEGETLARQRQAVMYKLIAKDPALALSASLNEPSRRQLPESIQSLLERPLSAKADLIVVVDDSAAHKIGRREVYRQVQIDGQTFDAYVYGRRALQQTKYGTSVIGVAINDRMAVLEEPTRILSKDSMPAGARVEPPLTDPANPSPAAAATGAHVLEVAGKYYPVASAEHAQRLAASWVAAEDRPGPIVQALGTSLPELQPAAAPALASSHVAGAQTVLAIVVDFTDATGRPADEIANGNPSITSTLIQQRVGVEAADFYTQASYGKATVGTVTVTNVLRMPSTLASYSTANNNGGMKNDALAAAVTAGFTPTNYDRQMVIFANTHNINQDQFTWAGLAELGGSFIWINGNIQLGVVAHELGHTFGLSHAKLWALPPNKTDPVDPTGSPLDYGDPFDIMGGAIGDPVVQPDPPNPWYLNNLGWLPNGAVQTIDSNSAQDYRVYRFDHQNATLTHPLALRVNRNEGTDYWLAFRRKYHNYPDLGDMGDGAYVFWAKDSTPSSELIDIDTPGTNPNDASLDVGKTFTDTAAGITLKVTGSGGTSPDEYLDVHVTFQTRIAFQHKINNVDETVGTATLVVQRLNSSDGAVSAHYTTVPGTAAAGTNYTTTTGTLNWLDGDMTPRTIQVPILVDSSGASSTSFTVKFDSSSGCVFPSGDTATINIQKTGSADSLFVHPFLTHQINALCLQPDGRIVIGGDFDNTSSPIASSGISRLESNGALDSSFDQGSGLSPVGVTTLARQPDGKILVAGDFTTIRGIARNHLARLLPNGSLDLGFDPGIGPASAAVINAVTVQPDGKILVGGEFTKWNGATHTALVRLNENGDLDSSFASFDTIVNFFKGFEDVHAIALQPTSSAPYFSIVVGGSFYKTGGATANSGIVRLNADGTRDSTFSSLQAGAYSDSFISSISSLAVQMDGKIVAGGQFNKFNGVAAKHLVRLTNAGANDTTFVSNLGTGLTSSLAFIDASCLRIQPDGDILVGGFFEKSIGVPQGIARFTASGTRDAGFFPTIESWAGNGVTSMELAPDNTVLIALNNAGSNPVVAKRIFTGDAVHAGVVQFTSVGSTVAEGSPATVYVDRTGGSSGKVTVNYQTIGRSAVAGTNFTTSNGTLTWNDGDSASKPISVPTALNGTTDPDLTFDIDLGIPMGGVSIGQRGVTSVTIQDTATNNVPKVEFAAAATPVTESNTSFTVTVTVSMAHDDTIVVPVVVTGTATQGAAKDYTLDTTTVTFAKDVLSQDITITLKEDVVAEGPETIILTLQSPTSGTALLGATKQHTVTISDDDIAPTFTTSPVNTVVSVGAATVTFHSLAPGNPSPAYQWFKNKVKITTAGTGSDYTLNNVQLTQATQYTVTATNIFGAPARTVELGVVDTTPKTYNITKNTTATLTVTSAGNLLTYTWTKGGLSALSAPRITASGKSLIIKTATSAADAGTYICNVSNPGGNSIPVTFTLNVIDDKPVVTNTGKMTDGIVSGDYSYDITVKPDANLTPNSYSTSTLPKGLVCNPVTGHISGKPLVNGSFNITLKATNAISTGSVTLPLTISTMTSNTDGSYMGIISRDASLNTNLGGRIDITIAPTGTYSGTLTLGATGYKFSGVLNAYTSKPGVDSTTTVTVANKASAQLTFAIDDPSSGELSDGTVTVGATTLHFTGWRSTLPTNKQTGYQTFSLALSGHAGDDGYPQGRGFGSFTVPATATTFSVSGVLADGTSFTSSSSLGPQGEILVYQAIYTGTGGTKGSVLGTLTLTPGTLAAPQNTDCYTTGSLNWNRPAIVGKTFANGFAPITITADGGRIDATKATTMPPGFTEHLSNASLTFTGAHVTDNNPVPASPDMVFTLKKGGGTTVPGLPNRTTFTLAAATGIFNGVFIQTAPAPSRTGTYKGILVNHAGTYQGDGWFTLPQPVSGTVLAGQVKLESKQ